MLLWLMAGKTPTGKNCPNRQGMLAAAAPFGALSKYSHFISKAYRYRANGTQLALLTPSGLLGSKR